MNPIITASLNNSCNYKEYRETISRLLSEGKPTGNDHSESLVQYTLLNQKRMKRLEKTLTIPKEIQQKADTIKEKYIWLVISEGWCGDSAQLVPIMDKVASASPNIELRFVFRDENEELMDMFLTDGGRSIPKLIVLDLQFNVRGSWGPRPRGAAELMHKRKLETGHIDDAAKTELQMWYLHDKGFSTQEELVTFMLEIEKSAGNGN